MGMGMLQKIRIKEESTHYKTVDMPAHDTAKSIKFGNRGPVIDIEVEEGFNWGRYAIAKVYLLACMAIIAWTVQSGRMILT